MDPAEREEPEPLVSPVASPPAAATDPRSVRGPISRKSSPRLLRRGLPLSALAHGSVLALALVLLGDVYPPRNSRPGPLTDVVASLERDPPDELSEEVIEPTPELELPEAELEPELVDAPFVPDELPPDEPAPELPDWLPPVDPLAQLERWKARPPAPPLADVVPEPQPEVLPEPLPEPEPPGYGEMPEVLESPKPRYPRKALRLGWEGTVRLRISVGATGRVTRVEVVQSCGRALLDEAAVKAFEQWVFRPRKAGEPEVRRFEKPFTFRLVDGG